MTTIIKNRRPTLAFSVMALTLLLAGCGGATVSVNPNAQFGSHVAIYVAPPQGEDRFGIAATIEQVLVEHGYTVTSPERATHLLLVGFTGYSLGPYQYANNMYASLRDAVTGEVVASGSYKDDVGVLIDRAAIGLGLELVRVLDELRTRSAANRPPLK